MIVVKLENLDFRRENRETVEVSALAVCKAFS